jgi:CheY-like chemotaxis protein
MERKELTMNMQGEMETPWRVLIVDDLPTWGDSISSIAGLFNCDVRVTTNLTAAVRELARWQPQLIILDLHMPRDEWEPLPLLGLKYKPNQKTLAFCEQVTTHPQLSHVVVAMVSVENQVEQQALALDAGAHFFYTKGDFDVEKFEFLLSQLRVESPAA